jgi:hypothetical protein
MSRIPKTLHFCFGFSANFGYKPWSLVHHVCVKSAIERIKPQAARLYYEFEPSGPWWDLSKPMLDLVKIEAPREIFGNPLARVAHRADVVRLEKLIAHGGIYLDCDILVHRSFDDLLDNECVISEEGRGASHGLSNAVLLAEPSASFLKRWHERYRDFRGGQDQYWVEHSVQLPLRLARQFPQEVKILRYSAFCWPLHYDEHLRWIFAPEQMKLAEEYATHLWETISWEKYLRHLTPGRVRETNSNFGGWAAPLLAGLPDDYGAPPFWEFFYWKAFDRVRLVKKKTTSLAGRIRTLRRVEKDNINTESDAK